MIEDLMKPDSNGDVPDQPTKNDFHTHARSGRTYMVCGWAWHGDTDEWCVLYQRVGSKIIYSRTLRNFYGEIEPGVLRFPIENNPMKWMSGGKA